MRNRLLSYEEEPQSKSMIFYEGDEQCPVLQNTRVQETYVDTSVLPQALQTLFNARMQVLRTIRSVSTEQRGCILLSLGYTSLRFTPTRAELCACIDTAAENILERRKTIVARFAEYEGGIVPQCRELTPGRHRHMHTDYFVVQHSVPALYAEHLCSTLERVWFDYSEVEARKALVFRAENILCRMQSGAH